MTGRTDNDTTTDDPDYQYQEGGLDLEINDYKPGMRRTTDTIFSDPAKNPRFEEFSKGGE